MRKKCMHIPSNFTSIYLHRGLPFCSMAKGNDCSSFLKGKKEGKKTETCCTTGSGFRIRAHYLHIALRPLNVTQKTMDSTVMLTSGRVFWNLVQDRSSFQSSASQKTEGKPIRCRQTNRPIIRYIEMLAAGAWCEKIDVSKSNAAHWLRVWGEIFKPMVMRHEEQIDELSS